MKIDAPSSEPDLHALGAAPGDRVLVLGDEAQWLEPLRRAGIHVEVVAPAQVERGGIDEGAGFAAVLCIDALPWLRDLDGALELVRCVLVPGGRFLCECDLADPAGRVYAALRDAFGRRGIRAAEVVPWLRQTPASLRHRLAAHRFGVLASRTFSVGSPTGILAALAVAATASEALPPAARPAFLHEVGRTLHTSHPPGHDARSIGVLRTTCLAERE